MVGDWSWRFERESLVLRDPLNRVRASVRLLRDGRWCWGKARDHGFTNTIAEGVRESLTRLELHPGVVEFLTDLAEKEIVRAWRRAQRE